MATLNLTTADNYQTITVNGTTIKQLWAKQGNNEAVKVYQKWKTESYNYTYYTNEAGSNFYGVAQSLKGYYKRSGWGNSYATYTGNIYIGCDPVSGRLVNGNAYVYGTFNGSGASLSISNAGSAVQDGKQISSVTYYRRNDGEYNSKNFVCSATLYTSGGSTTNNGTGSWIPRQTVGADTGNTTYTSSYRGYQGYARTGTGTRRVEDN